MKKVTFALFALALLAGPALAQGRGGAGAEPSAEEMEKKRDQAQLDRQYKNALRRSATDAAPAKVDPWANMRGPSEQQQPKR